MVWTVSKNLGTQTQNFVGKHIECAPTYCAIRTRTNDYNGAELVLGNETESTVPGEVQISAQNSAYSSFINFKPNGALRLYPQYTVGSPEYDLGSSSIVIRFFSTNGYIVYASGLIMQWGLYLVNAESTGDFTNENIPVSFPINFATTANATCMPSSDDNLSQNIFVVTGGIALHGINTTLKGRRTAGRSYGFYWQAIGY